MYAVVCTVVSSANQIVGAVNKNRIMRWIRELKSNNMDENKKRHIQIIGQMMKK
jgi:hypothetical protein